MYLCCMRHLRKELDLLEYGNVDIILFSGDAYVDHPSSDRPSLAGYWNHRIQVAIVPQPNWRDDLRDFKTGIPRLF